MFAIMMYLNHFRMRKLRDQNMEMPEKFWEHINEWALESITLIAFDTRLGILDDGPNSTDGKRLNTVSPFSKALNY